MLANIAMVIIIVVLVFIGFGSDCLKREETLAFRKEIDSKIDDINKTLSEILEKD